MEGLQNTGGHLPNLVLISVKVDMIWFYGLIHTQPHQWNSLKYYSGLHYLLIMLYTKQSQMINSLVSCVQNVPFLCGISSQKPSSPQSVCIWLIPACFKGLFLRHPTKRSCHCQRIKLWGNIKALTLEVWNVIEHSCLSVVQYQI